MAGCAAVGCRNSSKKGFLVKKFPKGRKRRHEWLLKMKRDNWTPTDRSVLCEVHFEPHMWEKTREDGTRRLKANAVPTIFSFKKPPPKRKPPALEEVIIVSKTLSDAHIIDLNQPSTSKSSTNAPEIKVYEMEESGSIIASLLQSPLQTSTSTDCNSSSDNQNDHILMRLTKKERIQMLRKSLQKKNILLHKLKIKNRSLRRKIKSLQNREKLSGKNESGVFQKIFNYDQIVALKKKEHKKSTKFMKWSDETVIKALKLKFSCGGSGYEELLAQNLPYPSIRTLQRHLQNLKFDSGVLIEVFQFLKFKVDSLNGSEGDCILVLDEKIQSSIKNHICSTYT